MATDAQGRRGKEPHDTAINVRMSARTRSLIDTAASLLGKTRSEFITESARRHAVDVLLDQRLFILEPEGFAAFEKALDDPPAPDERLKALVKKKPLWEA